MAISARRIILTAVKQRRGIARTRIDVSTAMVNQWSTNKCPSIHCNNYRDLSTNSQRDFREVGYTDVADLLSIPERDFLLRNNGQKVPVSSLKGKLVGLYLFEVIHHPPRNHATLPPNRMEAIKKVYEEARLRGYDFEIVQITFDFHAKHRRTSPIISHFREDILWLSLPSGDPSFKKIQRIFQCVDDKDTYWGGDSLILVHPPQAQADGILFEFSGAEILERWGIEGYPFTRPSLCKAEYEVLKREAPLQWFFPPGDCLLRRPHPGGDGFDLVDAVSQLSGKRVLVLFANHNFPFTLFSDDFVSMVKSEYEAQLEGDVPEESRFEVVYVSTTSPRGSSFDEFTKDMPWLVEPFPSEVNGHRLCKVFKPCASGSAAVAFNEQGELIAKEDRLNEKKKEGDHNLQFPFIDQDLEKQIRLEVGEAFSEPIYGRY